jgi:hypothetical protein
VDDPETGALIQSVPAPSENIKLCWPRLGMSAFKTERPRPFPDRAENTGNSMEEAKNGFNSG